MDVWFSEGGNHGPWYGTPLIWPFLTLWLMVILLWSFAMLFAWLVLLTMSSGKRPWLEALVLFVSNFLLFFLSMPLWFWTID